MNNSNNILPFSKDLNISAFSGMFSNVTNSYKFYFFLGIMENLKNNGFDNTISFDDLRIKMLTLSWYPYQTFHLSFGGQDQLTKNLNQIDNITMNHFMPNETEIRNKINNNDLGCDLLKFVPYRLIRPFFSNQLKGAKDAIVNKKVAEYADDLFEIEKPFYKISVENQNITIHNDWLVYLKLNYGIIKDWILWNLLEYMQKQNPNVPNLSVKLIPPQERTPLTSQRNLWNKILQENEIRCIFSGKIINHNDFALDHYLPWSYVGHDRLWNLIPINRNVNSSKSNCLPDESYFEQFVDIQHKSILSAKEIIAAKSWQKQMSCYLTDLFIPNFEELQNRSNLESALKKIVFPAIDLGSSMGFSKDWKYKATGTDGMSLQFANTVNLHSSQKGTLHKSQETNLLPLNSFTEKNEFEINDYLIEKEDNKYLIPFINLKVTANPIEYLQNIKSDIDFPDGWLNYNGKFDKDYFIMQIIGDSMEPKVLNNSYCLFRAGEGLAGSRNGRDILFFCKDNLGASKKLMLKRYFSKKEYDEYGNFKHTQIELKSLNSDYESIIFEEPVDDEIQIIGEFIKILDEESFSK